MTTFKEILKAVIERISLRDETNIISTDVEEGFLRPCYFVRLRNPNTAKHMQNAVEKSVNVRISYFPSDLKKNTLEILEKQDLLSEIFILDGSLKVMDKVIDIEKVEFDTVDKILHCEFSLYNLEIIEKEYEMMEDFYHDGGV